MIDYSSWPAFTQSVNDAASQLTETQILMIGVAAGVFLFLLGACIMRRMDRRRFAHDKHLGGKR